ncbi:MAG: conserved membrane protein of unknown function [Promethearchaeota archaeon]|nr:MAG: conserved membrane protein of unknown function [Candidatus Lokiarchaeota archaeon]
MGFIIITIPVVIIFIINGLAHLFYAFKLNKLFPEMHNFYNTILTVGLWIIGGLVYPFYFISHDDSLLFPILSVIFISLFTPCLIGLVLLYQNHYVIKRNPEVKEQREIKKYIEKCQKRLNGRTKDAKKVIFRIDLKRKSLHLFPAAVIIGLWIYSVSIWEGLLNQHLIWGINGQEYATFLIITAGYSGILVFAALDYLRLSYIFESYNYFHLIPDNVLDLLSRSMKEKELYEFTKPVALVLAFAPLFFLPFGIFSSIALISTIGDGAASLIGLKFGKINFPKNSPKTIIGYVAGFVSSFLIALLPLTLFQSNMALPKILIMALVASFIFLFIDLNPLKVDDNILNPLFCGMGMVLVYLFL